ncbi:MAG: tRNA (adenosine(37)-N6)-dimethylallyltransferase MiaA [Actinomycetota bacterium]
MAPRVLALVGPTAAGKSALALAIAPGIDAEIVSIDSTMVYRGMDIGTDKPSPSELAQVPHHLVDVVEPSRTLTVSEFQALARAAVDRIVGRGRTPLLVGGSGLYFRAVVDPLGFPPTDPAVRAGLELRAVDGPDELYEALRRLDPEAASRIGRSNARRIVRALEVIEITGRAFSSFRTGWDDYHSIYDLRVAAISWPRDELDRRIDGRVDRQIARGLVEEVRRLERDGFRASLTSVQALGYAQILRQLDGGCSLEEAAAETKRRTRRFARRQLTWFRPDPRVVWFEADPAGAGAFLAEATGRAA